MSKIEGSNFKTCELSKRFISLDIYMASYVKHRLNIFRANPVKLQKHDYSCYIYVKKIQW